MRKISRSYLVFLFALLLVPNIVQAQDIKLWINGDYVTTDTPPIIENDRTLVPLRVISENLGLSVEWVDEAKQAQIYNPTDNLIYTFKIGKSEYGKGDILVPMDVAPKIVNNKTFVPIRVISEAFGKKIDWDNNNRTVIIGEGYQVIINNTNYIDSNTEKITLNKNTNQTYVADTTQGKIKGNIKSKIYHVPGGASYNKISAKNVVYFDSESEAQNAGYRRARD